jgi:fructokinase
MGSQDCIGSPVAAGLIDHSSLESRPVVFGEVLFDTFPDGSRVLGGAPFNVAWHLQAFGFEPLMVTGVGRDDAGAEVERTMAEWGMDLAGVQRVAHAPTGQVVVSFDGDEPSYEIVSEQAFDRVSAGIVEAAAPPIGRSILYHGTLAARSAPARETIAALRRLAGGGVFVDVNLRQPWWDRDSVLSLLDGGSTWVKLNLDELEQLARAGESAVGGEKPAALARAFGDRLGFEQVVVTRGDRGAFVVSSSTVVEGRPDPVAEVVDTVGAGDGFSAVWIAGLLSGWDVATTLERALGFAARICTLRGATTRDRSFYERTTAGWHD